MPPTPTLETRRLTLRPPRIEDAPAIQRHFPHWEVVRWLRDVIPWPHPADGAETHLRECLERRERGEHLDWIICLRGREHEAIGHIELRRDDGTRDQRGFWIAREFQRQGLIMEAAEAVTAYAFLELNWPHLWLVNAEANVASHRIKEKQGAKLIDRVTKRYVSGEGTGEIWLLTRDDWIQRHRGSLSAVSMEGKSRQ